MIRNRVQRLSQSRCVSEEFPRFSTYPEMFAYSSIDVEYKMLNLLTKKIKRKASEIFTEFQNEQLQQ